MTRGPVPGTWTWVITLDSADGDGTCRQINSAITFDIRVPVGDADATSGSLSLTADVPCTLATNVLTCSLATNTQTELDDAFLTYVLKANSGTITSSGAQWLETINDAACAPGGGTGTAAVAINTGTITFDGMQP